MGCVAPSQPDHHLHHPRPHRPLHRAQRAAAAIPPGPSHRHPEVSGAAYDGVQPGTATGWRASPLEPFALAPWRADGEAPRPPPSGPAPTARSDSGRGGSPGRSPARIRLRSPAATHVPQRGEFRFLASARGTTIPPARLGSKASADARCTCEAATGGGRRTCSSIWLEDPELRFRVCRAARDGDRGKPRRRSPPRHVSALARDRADVRRHQKSQPPRPAQRRPLTPRSAWAVNSGDDGTTVSPATGWTTSRSCSRPGRQHRTLGGGVEDTGE